MLQKILILLADGAFHSGDELGQSLGVSRTAVWKHLKKVEELGLSITSIKGKGYQIDGGLDLLSLSVIENVLAPRARSLVDELVLYSTVTSTNQLAMQRAITGGHGFVCAAEQQTAGRGRRGRVWVSPYAANIYLSIVWEFAAGAAALEGLSLAVGIAVAEALADSGVADVQLKWPNDVIHQDRKLAGVLLEMVGDAAGPCRVVVGIGLNVAMPVGGRQEIDQPWTDIRSIIGRRMNRSHLLAVLLNRVLPLLAEFEHKGFSHYQSHWQALDAYHGKEVCIRVGESVESGVAVGVDRSGAIIIKTNRGSQLYNAGEVSLRRAG